MGDIIIKMVDVPGFNDHKLSDPKIIQDIKDSGETINSILLVHDINQDRWNRKDIEIFKNLAHTFKHLGLKLWSKVIVIFSRANEFNIVSLPGGEEPVYDAEYMGLDTYYADGVNRGMTDRYLK